jgi:hypothetical protein
MSKKKGKAAARTAPKKKTTALAKSRAATRSTAAATGATSQVTIMLFRTPSGNKIRTTPQKAFAGPGHVEWTVVNMIDGSDVPVRITWPNGSPWPAEPGFEVKSCCRMCCDDVKPGVYKYVVHAYDTQEDPEIEFPQN